MHAAVVTLAVLATLVAAPAAHAVTGDAPAPPTAPREGARPEGAAGDPESEPEIALRLAVAPAFGDAASSIPMSDAVALQFPLQLDVGWRLGHLAVGAYGSWAPARAPDCDRGASCSASVLRFGLQATWTFEPSGRMQGWLGAGTGWERATFHVRRGATDDATSYTGLELLQGQGGLEWRLHRRLAVGPFVLLGIGRYTDVRVRTNVQSASAPLSDRTLHLWLHAGVRARVPLGGPW